jgi:hypothetical protein
MRLEGLGKLKNLSRLIGSRIRDLPVIIIKLSTEIATIFGKNA